MSTHVPRWLVYAATALGVIIGYALGSEFPDPSLALYAALFCAALFGWLVCSLVYDYLDARMYADEWDEMGGHR